MLSFLTPLASLNYFYKDSELFENNCKLLMESLLIEDKKPLLSINEYVFNLPKTRSDIKLFDFIYTINWSSNGEVIAGSSIINTINPNIVANDFDIYFKSYDHLISFLNINPDFNVQLNTVPKDGICLYVKIQNTKTQSLYIINLIYGIPYETPQQLISSFDIRACAIAIDPISQKLYEVDGAINDSLNKRLVFLPYPRSVTIARLVKYLSKGLTIDRFQRKFFAELVKTDKYSSFLEEKHGAY